MQARCKPRDEAHARLLEQKRKSYAKHRERRKREMREWYRGHQASVRAQQSRYNEERNAWKYRQSAVKWYGMLGGTADRLSVINEFELRFPNYKFVRDGKPVEYEFEEWLHEKGGNMAEPEKREGRETRHERERNELNERHREHRIALADGHRAEHQKLETKHRHERKGGPQRTDEQILED